MEDRKPPLLKHSAASVALELSDNALYCSSGWPGVAEKTYSGAKGLLLKTESIDQEEAINSF